MDQVIIAAISLMGSLIGTFGGILTAERLLSYRITQLEKRMEEVKELVKRIYQLEQRTAIHEERLKSASFGGHIKNTISPN